MKTAFGFLWLILFVSASHGQEAIAQEATSQEAIAQEVTARAGYAVMVDESMSARVGAENLAAAHRALYGLENRLLKPRLFDERTVARKSAGVLYRLGKSLLVDNVIDYLAMLTQHEVFGHGARMREFGFKRITYRLALPPPYGRGTGSASGYTSRDRRTTRHERISVYAGGSEANTLLSSSIRSRWLHRGRANTRELALYLYSSMDLTGYILQTRDSSGDNAGRDGTNNDILNYLKDINGLEGYTNPDSYELTLERLRTLSLIRFLDPTVIWALYTYGTSYLLRGASESTLPMLRTGRIGYLPVFRLGLTPFGPAVHLENLFVAPGRVLNIHLRYGVPSFHRFGGIGASYDRIVIHRGISLEPRVELWHQPALLLGGRTTRTGTKGFGGGLWLEGRYTHASLDLAPAVLVEAGYKTDGFLEGEPLARGFVLRFGLSFRAH